MLVAKPRQRAWPVLGATPGASPRRLASLINLAGPSGQGKRMRSALIKGAVQAAALGNLCAAKQDFKPRSELGFLPVENGQTGLSAPKIKAPDLMRLPWLTYWEP